MFSMHTVVSFRQVHTGSLIGMAKGNGIAVSHAVPKRSDHNFAPPKQIVY